MDASNQAASSSSNNKEQQQQSQQPLQGMMDIIDPSYDGPSGLDDGDELLQALSDHEDLMDFEDHGNDNNNNIGRSQSNGSSNNGGGRGFHRMGSSSNNSCSSEPFMLDDGFYQQMSAASNRIGATIKAPLVDGSAQRRGRGRRVPRRKPRSRSGSMDAHKQMFDNNQQQPLFGSQFDNDREFNDSMVSMNSADQSDVASACSAPADLFELGGLYNDSNHGMGGHNEDSNYDPTAIPDVMDIQKMLIMRGLLEEGGDGNNNSNEFQPAQISRPNNNNQGRPRRRNTVDNNGNLGNSLGSQDSANMDEELRNSQGSGSNGNGHGGQRMRRRKTLDDPLSIMMGGMGDMPTMEQLQMDFDSGVDMFDNHGGGMDSQPAPLKRRKSEPMMVSNFWDEDGDEEEDDMRDMNQRNNSMSGGNQQNNMMSSTFLAAAQEAFASINRLKELMNGAGGSALANAMGASMQGLRQEQGPRGRAMQGSRQQQNQWQPRGGRSKSRERMLQRQGSGPQGQRQGRQQQQQVRAQQGSYRRKGSSGSANSAPADFLMEDQEPAPCAPPVASPPQARTSPPSRGKPSSIKKGKRSKSKEPVPPAAASPAVVPKIPLPKKEDPEILKMDQSEVMAKLQAAMEKTTNTQKLLQEWDRANGLPKSHSQTMVNSSRSRKQLTDGVILKKWNGAPLLNFAKEGGDVTKSRLNHSALP